jgi:hypothetical protein
MGRTDALAIFDCALTAFPGGKPARDREQRNNQLARWGEKQFTIFDRLDSAFFASPTLYPSIDKYTRAHIGDMPHVKKALR